MFCEIQNEEKAYFTSKMKNAPSKKNVLVPSARILQDKSHIPCSSSGTMPNRRLVESIKEKKEEEEFDIGDSLLFGVFLNSRKAGSELKEVILNFLQSKVFGLMGSEGWNVVSSLLNDDFI